MLNTGDNTIIFNIQIALLGIVLVTAFFYLWRMIGRVEDRLESLERRMASALGALSGLSGPIGGPFIAPDQDIMDQIFNIQEPPAESAVLAPVQQSADIVITEEAPQAPAEPVAEAEETPSETASIGLSKTKIRKMSVDALREACKERGLSSDGSRSQLMERLMD